MSKGTIKAAIAEIRDRGLHGIEVAVPARFARGIDVLDGWEEKFRQSCKVFAHHHGFEPNLIDPKGFTQKQLLFKFFGLVPIDPVPSDKLLASCFVPESHRHLVTLPDRYWISDRPEVPADDALPPGRYYFKSNHGWSTHRPITLPMDAQTRRRLTRLTGRRLTRLTGRWLADPHQPRLSLWWYERIKRQVFVEEHLGSAMRDAPDWKFFVCNGRVEVFQVDIDRSANHIQTLYDRDGTFLPVELFFDSGPPVEMPPQLDTMIEVAEAIGQSFDFIRVDFFLKDDRVYLGEIGMVPNGATRPIRSAELDERLGAAWQPPWLGQGITDFNRGHYPRFKPLPSMSRITAAPPMVTA
ncbi:ATP-grasp fold amidoligase family protein [Roseicyclus mahoneyensis]|uniref:Teichuronopeptide biosynthesis TupA-like protein n=1 Tax=Roseicyclus mahoneyensis TaxID=164332 RepID=A0A316GIQ8_9RHOB|nr:ATP-grasp fold amidoligase family protein [Roseicyclus mahoneyensis]PWK59280.1 teichuronopeptide biosynthesis TupA-like protein [Roseicyclus mahoneyensis]